MASFYPATITEFIPTTVKLPDPEAEPPVVISIRSSSLQAVFQSLGIDKTTSVLSEKSRSSLPLFDFKSTSEQPGRKLPSREEALQSFVDLCPDKGMSQPASPPSSPINEAPARKVSLGEPNRDLIDHRTEDEKTAKSDQIAHAPVESVKQAALMDSLEVSLEEPESLVVSGLARELGDQKSLVLSLGKPEILNLANLPDVFISNIHKLNVPLPVIYNQLRSDKDTAAVDFQVTRLHSQFT